MKTIAIFDEPKRCHDCPCYNDVTCQLLHEQIGTAWSILHRRKDCPLIAMPSKRKSAVEWLNGMKTHEPTDFDKGWNECVDYLGGDGNG